MQAEQVKNRKPRNRQEINKFWDFANKGDKSAELILYGEISSYSWWGDEITPSQFSDDLKAIGDVSEIVVRINSGGGDVFAANAIYARLKDHAAKITVKIDGWAASAATIIAMAGDVIQIPSNGVFMIHDPQMCIWGYFKAEELQKLSAELAVIKQSIVNGYALKTCKDETSISALMSAETWYTGAMAVENGFCDELMFGEVESNVENDSRIVVNSVAHDLGRYRIPAAFMNKAATAQQNKQTKQTTAQAESSKFNAFRICMKGKGGSRMEIKTLDELRAEYPELVAQAANEATLAERKRIQEIEDVTLKGYEAIADKAKFETPASAAEVAKSIIAEQKKQASAFIANTAEDIKNSGMQGVGAMSREGIGDKSVNPYEAAIDKVLPEGI